MKSCFVRVLRTEVVSALHSLELRSGKATQFGFRNGTRGRNLQMPGWRYKRFEVVAYSGSSKATRGVKVRLFQKIRHSNAVVSMGDS